MMTDLFIYLFIFFFFCVWLSIYLQRSTDIFLFLFSYFCGRARAAFHQAQTFVVQLNRGPASGRPHLFFCGRLGIQFFFPVSLFSGVAAPLSSYSVSAVPVNEFPSDLYALGFAGYKLKETSKLGPRPEKPIEIYEFESCPFCRKVREIVSVLDLDVLYYPCPRNGPNFRPKVSQMGGKQQFPSMVDPNTGVSTYESDDIIKYLVGKYGDGNVPLLLSLGLFTTFMEGLAMIGRMGKGSSYTPSKLPAKSLEIWAYEASPFCKVVREVLVELELPHILHSWHEAAQKGICSIRELDISRCLIWKIQTQEFKCLRVQILLTI